MNARTVAVIGLGRMGYRHVEAARVAGFNVIAVHDPFENAFGFTQEPALRALSHRTPQALFGAGADLVVVATTAPAHLPLVKAGLEGGARRFVVEKPLTGDPGEALEMRRLVQAAGARVLVNHGRRYFPAYREVRDRLSGSPEMGELRMVCVTQGAGGLGCLGVHYLDLCNFLFDAQPESVYAMLTKPVEANPRGAQFDDPGGLAVLHYSGGRRGVVEIGDDIGVLGQIELRFERGAIRIVNEGEPWTALRRRADVRDRPNSFYGAPLERFDLENGSILSVIDAAAAVQKDALSDGPPLAGVDIGVQVMECLAACHLSHRRGAPVRLPLAESEMALGLRIP